MTKKFAVFISVILLFEPQAAFAYLDPGTGSMLLSVVVGLVSSAYFLARRLPSLIRAFFYKLSGKKDDLKTSGIVFYSERASYWSTFEPVLRALETKGEPVTYLTSDQNDPVFKAGLKNVTATFVGQGQTAYTALGFVQADIFCLTTPGIDVLQIRRSAGVKRYVHIVHAIGDIHTYKLYSFDYYNAVFCAGRGQAKSLRALERIRGTRPKDLPLLGCPYLDRLVARHKAEPREPSADTILVAPTWGKNSLLTRLGASVVIELAKAGYHVILRPHPQSFVSDAEVMEGVLRDIEPYSLIELDRNPDGFESMSRAALMISDISGIMFDFAFVFLRPVISLGDGPVKDGFEAWDIPHEAWEDSILNTIGCRLPVGEEKAILQTVRDLLEKDRLVSQEIQKVRDIEVANFGAAGIPIAEALLKMKAEILTDA